jgi:hypothetical protein
LQADGHWLQGFAVYSYDQQGILWNTGLSAHNDPPKKGYGICLSTVALAKNDVRAVNVYATTDFTVNEVSCEFESAQPLKVLQDDRFLAFKAGTISIASKTDIAGYPGMQLISYYLTASEKALFSSNPDKFNDWVQSRCNSFLEP